MTARRTLLTGAAGFVGAGLAHRLLRDGHHVHVLLRPNSDSWRLAQIRGALVVHQADLRDPDAVRAAVRAASPEWVFHLATHGAYSWQADPRGIFESNVLGTLHLLDACTEEGFEAFVHAGSSSEYGFKDHAPSEDETPEPDSDYAIAKVTATMLCRQRAMRYGVRTVTLRLYSVYGPWEDPRRLVPTLVVHGLRGELPPLVDPDTARDFVHIEDVCDAFFLAAGSPLPTPGAIYNVGSGIQTTLREVVEAARRALGVAAEPDWGSHPARSWDTRVWVADPAKIAHDLDWRTTWDIERGIRHMADWVRQHPELAERYGVQR